MIARSRSTALSVARRCACGSASAPPSNLSITASTKTTADLCRSFSLLTVRTAVEPPCMPRSSCESRKGAWQQLRSLSSQPDRQDQDAEEEAQQQGSTSEAEELASAQASIDDTVSATTGSGGAAARPLAMPGSSSGLAASSASTEQQAVAPASSPSSSATYSSPFLTPEQMSQQRDAAAPPRYSMPGEGDRNAAAAPAAQIRRPFPLWVVTTGHGNTKLTLTRPNGNPLTWTSGGTAGFKKSQRSGYEAGYRASTKMFGMIGQNRTKWGVDSVEIVFKGMTGTGRDAFSRALLSQEGAIVRKLAKSVRDASPLKIGGTRPKKARNY